MSQPIEDGGAAFPVVGFGEVIHGMSLRDWFAGMAMSVMMTQAPSCKFSSLEVALACYDFADDMLEARKGES